MSNFFSQVLNKRPGEDSTMMSSNSGINNGSYKASDSNEINFAFDTPKRVRYEENGAFQKFKGVVPQQNGHWGAQIYANHHRIWLGTFKTVIEAAMAYDSATIKLRSGESHRNFAWNEQNVQEPHFQSTYSTEAVLGMIKDGTYPSKFSAFLKTQNKGKEGVGISGNEDTRVEGDKQFSCTHLFQKELTPSDVGKLNRLVIPKKYAVTPLPYGCASGEANNENDGGCVDMEVVYYDKLMRPWKFRYCYWKSSQSYVFTRGWNRFVKDKKLMAKDIIVFYMCESDWRKGGQVFTLIDVIYNAEQRREECLEETKQIMGNMLLPLGEVEDGDKGEERKDTKDLNSPKGLRLFGVCIN